jgi:hypothetical protein
VAIRKVSNSGLDGSIYKDASAKTSKIADIPDTPTIGTATAGAESATITYTVANTGGIGTTFTALSNPGSITGTGSSPITVSGLTGSVSYTFTVKSGNSTGDSPYSSASNSATPTAGGSYDFIAISTPGSGVSSVTFSSIPNTYKNLQLRVMTKIVSGAATNLGTRFNGDTGNNYSWHQLYAGDGSTNAGGGSSHPTSFNGHNYMNASTWSASIIDINDYASTNKYKTTKTFGGADNNASGFLGIQGSHWRNTAAINSITIYDPYGGNSLAGGSIFGLYGIKG